MMNAETDAQSPASQGPLNDQNRIRIAKACSACSRQKLRCDGSQPCTRCQSLGSPDQCVYLPSMRGKIKRRRIKTSVDVTSTAPDSQSIRSPGRTTNRDVESRGRKTLPENTELWESNTTQARPSSLSNRPKSPRQSPRRLSLSLRRDSASELDHLTTTLPLPGDAHNPLAVLVELSEAAAKRRVQDTSPAPYQRPESSKRQREEEEYYAPLERTLKDEAPLIMALISTHEAKQLFDTFFTHLHPHLPLLDREQSAPGAIARRNNFLFNAICCAAARSHNVVIWSRLKDFARSEMERLPREKSIDVVQGHLIYSWWNLIRPTRFEQDMTWLRAGLATRTAVDIALHRVGLLEAAREGLPPSILKSFIRTWLFCFIVDRTLSVHLGKPNGRQWESEAVRYIEYLRQSSEYKGVEVAPTEDDIFTASLAEWALILSQAIDAFRLQELQTSTMADSHGTSSSLSLTFAGQLEHWRETSKARWDIARQKGSSRAASAASSAGGDHLEVYENYARLVIQSLALQHAQDTAPLTLPPDFVEYKSCAIRLIEAIEESRRLPRTTRTLPDFIHTALTYASTSLLRCTQARFSHMHPDRQQIFDLSRRAADMLAEAAIDSSHIAAVQSALVSKLISARDTPPHSVQHTTEQGQQLVSPNQAFKMPLGAVDFESFARALNGDQNMTPWPPIAPLMDLSSNAGGWFPDASIGSSTSTSNISGAENGVMPRDVGVLPDGLASWVSQQDLNIGSTGLGPGLDEFFNLGMSGTNPEFFDDAAWQSLFGNPNGNTQT